MKYDKQFSARISDNIALRRISSNFNFNVNYVNYKRRFSNAKPAAKTRSYVSASFGLDSPKALVNIFYSDPYTYLVLLIIFIWKLAV